VAGARAESTQVYWSEDSHTLTVHAPTDCAESPASGAPPGSSGSVSWYAEVPVASDVDASRAHAFLQHGTLRIVAPRIDSHPLTGLPLLVWTDAASSWSLVPTT
ncbi:MAG TPA: Hsp20/alpha crystallin family protein, partial [Polyangiaceae bacterium]|nr:Hsp20/alpha crystallin family protein [Polyangiaceae bacterium]